MNLSRRQFLAVSAIAGLGIIGGYLFLYSGKKKYYARGFSRYINKWGRDDPTIKKQFGVYYRFIGVFVEEGKWKKIIAHPFLTINMLSLRLMVGLVFLYSRFFSG